MFIIGFNIFLERRGILEETCLKTEQIDLRTIHYVAGFISLSLRFYFSLVERRLVCSCRVYCYPCALLHVDTTWCGNCVQRLQSEKMLEEV